MPMIDLGSGSYASFADQDWADDFLAADVARATGWVLRNADAKARGLVSATRLLMRLIAAVPPLDPRGEIADQPEVIMEVTAMLAADLLAKPQLFANASQNSNIKSVKAGSASVEFFQPLKGGPALPRALWDMLVLAGFAGLADQSEIAAPFVSGISSCDRPLGGRYPWDDWPFVQTDYD
jgi:hypothetical protein